MTGIWFGAAIGVVAALFSTPMLAALTLRAPDRMDRQWWHLCPTPAALRARVAVTAALCAGLGGAAAGRMNLAVLPALVVLGLLSAPLVLIDLAEHRLPDRLVGPGYGIGTALLTIASATTGRWAALGWSACCAVAVLVVLGVASLVSSGLGLGDAKYGGLLAAHLGWLSPSRVLPGLWVGFVIGALAAIAFAVRHRDWRRPIAFGPALALGAFVVAAFWPSG